MTWGTTDSHSAVLCKNSFIQHLIYLYIVFEKENKFLCPSTSLLNVNWLNMGTLSDPINSNRFAICSTAPMSAYFFAIFTTANCALNVFQLSAKLSPPKFSLCTKRSSLLSAIVKLYKLCYSNLYGLLGYVGFSEA